MQQVQSSNRAHWNGNRDHALGCLTIKLINIPIFNPIINWLINHLYQMNVSSFSELNRFYDVAFAAQFGLYVKCASFFWIFHSIHEICSVASSHIRSRFTIIQYNPKDSMMVGLIYFFENGIYPTLTAYIFYVDEQKCIIRRNCLDYIK